MDAEKITRFFHILKDAHPYTVERQLQHLSKTYLTRQGNSYLISVVNLAALLSVLMDDSQQAGAIHSEFRAFLEQ